MHDIDFSLRRVFKMICNDLYVRRMQIATSAVIILAVYWSFALLSWIQLRVGNPSYGSFYLFEFCLFGMVFTADSFREAATLRTGVLFLGQPASVMEKYLARFIWTGPGYVLAFNVFWYAATIILSLMVRLFLSKDISVFPLVPEKIVINISLYFLLHAIMLAGAVLFKKSHFLLSFAGMGVSWFATILLLMLLNVRNFIVVFIGIQWVNQVAYSESIRHKVLLTDTLIYNCFFMPLLWFAAYWLFREKEV